MVDRTGPIDASVAGHVETCLRCQAELARYKRLLRGLQLLRTQFLEPAPGLLASTLVAVTEASERRAIRSVLSGRRAAYAGAIAAATVAASRPVPSSLRTAPAGGRPHSCTDARVRSRTPKDLCRPAAILTGWPPSAGGQ